MNIRDALWGLANNSSRLDPNLPNATLDIGPLYDNTPPLRRRSFGDLPGPALRS
jgi:hypothetical protein